METTFDTRTAVGRTIRASLRLTGLPVILNSYPTTLYPVGCSLAYRLLPSPSTQSPD